MLVPELARCNIWTISTMVEAPFKAFLPDRYRWPWEAPRIQSVRRQMLMM
jgi:hypothetical protein